MVNLAPVNRTYPLYYIAVTLTNNQAGSTLSNYQMLITMNTNANSTYFSSTINNANWQDGNGNILYSWLESGETNTSNPSTYWVNLAGNTIAGGGGTLIIYQAIYATSQNVFDGNLTGAEPNYTGTYQQYDNGSNVFLDYDNFNGSSLSGNWASTTTSTIVVNNGVSVEVSGTVTGTQSMGGIVYTADNLYNQLWLCDAMIKSSTSGDTTHFFYGTLNTGSTSLSGTNNTLNTEISFSAGAALKMKVKNQNPSGTVNQATASGTNTASTYFIWTLGGDTSGKFTVANQNYSTLYSSLPLSTYNPTTQYIGIGAEGKDTTDPTLVQWFRKRLYPPSGVLPSISAGSLTASFNSIMIAM